MPSEVEAVSCKVDLLRAELETLKKEKECKSVAGLAKIEKTLAKFRIWQRIGHRITFFHLFQPIWSVCFPQQKVQRVFVPQNIDKSTGSNIAAQTGSMQVIYRQIVARSIAHHGYNRATNCEEATICQKLCVMYVSLWTSGMLVHDTMSSWPMIRSVKILTYCAPSKFVSRHTKIITIYAAANAQISYSVTHSVMTN